MATSAPEVGRSGESRCSCTALRKAARRVSQLYDLALSPSGLKITQRAILAQIGRSEPITVGVLAAALVMDSGALGHTLKPLERDGFVSIGVDPADRRSRLLSLTPEGRAKLAETDALWAQAQSAFETALGPEHSEALRAATAMVISEEFMASFEKRLTFGPDH